MVTTEYGIAMKMLNAETNHSLYQDLGQYLTTQELDMIASHNNMMSFTTDQIILQQGKFSQGIYLIISGTVTVSAKLLGEGTTNLETLKQGNFFGEASFIENIPSPTSITANSEVHCLFLNRTYMEFLSAYHPEIKYHLLHAICKQVCYRIKQVHDTIIKFISSSDMTTRPLFGEIIQSLTKPTEISPEESIEDIKQLHQFAIFEPFSQVDMAEILSRSTLLKAPKNCTLIHKGEKNAASYIVIHGAVQSSIVHAKTVAKLSVIGPATLFTCIHCTDSDSSYTITFTTCEQSILLKISENDLHFFQNDHPTIWYKLFDLICLSLVALEKSVDKLDIRLNIETYNR